MKCDKCGNPTRIIRRVILEDGISFIEITGCLDCLNFWTEKSYFGELAKEHRRMKNE